MQAFAAFFVVLLGFFPKPIAPGVEAWEGTCLLAVKTSIARMSTNSTGQLQEWRRKHAYTVHLANRTHHDLENFIAQQAESGDACHARMLEAKRTLDHLLHDVHTLALEVGSHETVLQTLIEDLNMTKLSTDAIEDSYKKELENCEKEKIDALAELQQYRAELKELEQIANPAVRYEHALKQNTSKTSLLQTKSTSTFSPTGCVAFVQFVKNHRYADDPSRSGGLSKETCDTQREKLQEVFTETYKAISKLTKDAEDRSTDSMCTDAAEARKMAELAPITMQREKTSTKIEEASEAISGLEPVLDMAKQRAKMMEKHIETVLKPECADAAEVSKMLQNIRDLIVSVEQCPGFKRLHLKVPETASTTVKEKVPETASTTVKEKVPETASTTVKGPDAAMPKSTTALQAKSTTAITSTTVSPSSINSTANTSTTRTFQFNGKGSKTAAKDGDEDFDDFGVGPNDNESEDDLEDT